MMKADPKQTHVAVQLDHSSPFISCRFDPTGKYVFASAEDQTIVRWEIATKKKVQLAAHDSWVRGLAFLDGGQTLVTGGFDGRLIWWPAAAAAPKPIRQIEAHKGWIRTISVSPDGKLLATGGNDHRVKLWTAADGKLVREFSGHESHVYSTAFHPDGKFLISGDLLGKIKQWDVASGKLIRDFEGKDLHSYNSGQQVHYGGVRSIAFSPDKKRLACGGLYKATNPLGAVNYPLVVVFDWETQKKTVSHIADGVKGVAWRSIYHPDGFLIGDSGGSGGGYLLFWKASDAKVFHKLKLPNTARDLDLHPDGIRIVTAHHDKRIRISSMTPKSKKS